MSDRQKKRNRYDKLLLPINTQDFNSVLHSR